MHMHIIIIHNYYTAGEDFEALDLVILSFEAGELRKCIDITIIEDGLEEGSEPEYIALQLLPDSFSGQDDIDINVRLYQVAILDSDGKYSISIASLYWNLNSLISCCKFCASPLPCPVLHPTCSSPAGIHTDQL